MRIPRGRRFNGLPDLVGDYVGWRFPDGLAYAVNHDGLMWTWDGLAPGDTLDGLTGAWQSTGKPPSLARMYEARERALAVMCDLAQRLPNAQVLQDVVACIQGEHLSDLKLAGESVAAALKEALEATAGPADGVLRIAQDHVNAGLLQR